MALNNFG